MPGFVAYRGPSQIDGAPITLVVLTGESTNRKTGSMVQTYIIRADIDPVAAIKTGADVSICGDCRHRGDGTGKGRSCYVNVGQGALSVYRAMQRGRYVTAAPEMIAALITGRRLRIGTYGDPAAVPVDVWRALLARVAGHTGYSHQWRKLDAAQWSPLVMASADSEDDVDGARILGYRTFRVRRADAPMVADEISCPASEEAGKRTQCDKCGLCAGTSARTPKTIAIIAHGTGKSHFAKA